MNVLWIIMIVAGIVTGIATGRTELLTDSMLKGAGEAVTLSISLIGSYMFFMGLMEVAGECGLVGALSRGFKPVLSRLFPSSPAAVAPITLNLAANFLGLGNAATPFGLEAMKELNGANRDKPKASDDMCMFIALNASAIELLPTQVIAIRNAAGAQDSSGLILPTFISSVIGFAVAALLCKAFAGRKKS